MSLLHFCDAKVMAKYGEFQGGSKFSRLQKNGKGIYKEKITVMKMKDWFLL